MSISSETCLDIGFVESESTKEWWATQNQDVLNKIISSASPVADVLREFSAYIKKCNPIAIWSHATFDFVIVQNYLKRLGLTPMNHRAARDIRTLVDMSGINLDSYDWTGKTHDALDDCKFQIAYCVDALNILKGGKK